MKRRSFLKLLAAGVAAIGVGVSIAPRPRINPAWINATYETSFLFHKSAYDRLIPHSLLA